jgi:hypothetical protein
LLSWPAPSASAQMIDPARNAQAEKHAKDDDPGFMLRRFVAVVSQA